MSQLAFDLEAGRARRDSGMAKNRAKDPEWHDLALKTLKTIRTAGLTITADVVREQLRARGVPEPKSKNSWGALVRAACRAGILKDTGRAVQATLVTSRARRLPVWEFT